MKLIKLAQAMLVGCSILALGGCAAMHKDDGSDAMNGGNRAMAENAAQSSGAGDATSFGDQAGSSTAAGKRTYYFDYDKSEVREADKPAITANADYLVAHSNAKVMLQGHTDPRGSREYNVALGERRANAVLDMMKSRGVNPDQVNVVSFGAERPASPGHTETDYQKDRRAQIEQG